MKEIELHMDLLAHQYSLSLLSENERLVFLGASHNNAQELFPSTIRAFHNFRAGYVQGRADALKEIEENKCTPSK